MAVFVFRSGHLYLLDLSGCRSVSWTQTEVPTHNLTLAGQARTRNLIKNDCSFTWVHSFSEATVCCGWLLKDLTQLWVVVQPKLGLRNFTRLWKLWLGYNQNSPLSHVVDFFFQKRAFVFAESLETSLSYGRRQRAYPLQTDTHTWSQDAWYGQKWQLFCMELSDLGKCPRLWLVVPWNHPAMGGVATNFSLQNFTRLWKLWP